MDRNSRQIDIIGMDFFLLSSFIIDVIASKRSSWITSAVLWINDFYFKIELLSHWKGIYILLLIRNNK